MMSKIIKLSVRNLNDNELSQINDECKDFPQIALTFNDEAGNEIGCEYMYPLRGYFFQIGGLGANGVVIQSNSFFGGAKEYIQKLRIIGMGDSSIKGIFNSEASSCILAFVRTFAGNHNTSIQGKIFRNEIIGEECDFRIDPTVGSMNDLWHKDSVWSKFISHTFEYFNK